MTRGAAFRGGSFAAGTRRRTGNIPIKTLGAPVSSWTLGFAFTGAQKVTQGWSATWSQPGATVPAASMSYNGSPPTGATAGIGFNGTWTGSNPKPAAFTLNGVNCNGTVPTSQPPSSRPPSSPPPSSPPPSSPPPQNGAAPK